MLKLTWIDNLPVKFLELNNADLFRIRGHMQVWMKVSGAENGLNAFELSCGGLRTFNLDDTVVPIFKQLKVVSDDVTIFENIKYLECFTYINGTVNGECFVRVSGKKIRNALSLKDGEFYIFPNHYPVAKCIANFELRMI